MYIIQYKKRQIERIQRANKKLICWLISYCFLGTEVFAAPMGANNVAGVAHVTQNGKITQIEQITDKAIINWENFDIAADETVHFSQPNSNSMILNRIQSPHPTQIHGTIKANGAVALVNQNGIIFHEGSHIDVNKIITSTADIKNSDFMAGNLNFSIPGNQDAETHLNGKITLQSNGLAAFVSPKLYQNGIITGHLAKITLAAGDTWTLDMGGLVKLSLSQETAKTLIQKGNITGGTVRLTINSAKSLVKSVINLGGQIEATNAIEKNGEIILSGPESEVIIQDQAKITSDNISIEADEAYIHGKIKATEKVKIQSKTIESISSLKIEASEIHQNATTGAFSSGTYQASKKIILSGNNALIGATLEAPEIAIGAASNYEKPPTINLKSELEAKEPQKTYILNGTKLTATEQILIWSSGETQFYGQATAPSLEISGPKLELNPSGITSKNLILDPTDIIITDTYPDAVLAVQMGLGVTMPVPGTTTLTLANNDYFGYSSSLNNVGDILVIGAHGTSSSKGAVYIFDLDTSTKIATLKDTLSNGNHSLVLANNDRFGNALDLNAAGDILAVGAYGTSSVKGAVYIFEINTGTKIATLTDTLSDGNHSLVLANSNYFGRALDLNAAGDILAVGATGTSISKGAVYIFEINTGTKIATPWKDALSDGNHGLVLANSNYFGIALDLNAAGDILAVGAHGTSSSKGAVYIFEINIGTKIATPWKDALSDGNHSLVLANNNIFGYALDLNAAGDILAVGAYGTSSFKGAVYIFEINTGTKVATPWKDALSDGNHSLVLANSNYFGNALDLNAAGDILAVGAFGTSSSKGAVYIFEINTGTKIATPWKDALSDGNHSLVLANNNIFGYALDLNAAGDILAVGAYGTSSSKGAVYIFSVDTAGTKEATLESSLENGMIFAAPPTSIKFGHATALNSAGDIMAVSAFEDYVSTGNGAVYLFDVDPLNPGGTVNFSKKISSATPGLTVANNEAFGSSVAINDSGSALAVGATGAGAPFKGAVYLMNLDPTDLTLDPTVRARLDDSLGGLTLTSDDSFGYSVALNGAGDLLMVGDPFSASGGSVHTFSLDGILGATYRSTVNIGNGFGNSVALNSAGDIAAIGAPFDDTGNADAGKVYIYSAVPATGVLTQESVIDNNHPSLTLAASKYFGTSVALNDAGDLLAIGSSTTSSGHSSEVSADVMSLNTSDLTESAVHVTKIDNSHASLTIANSESFARSLAFNDLGNVLLIGAPLDDDLYTDAGAVYYMTLDRYSSSTFYAITSDIEALINAGTNVILQADNNITTTGDLDLNGLGNLTLEAGNDITISNHIINSSSGKITLEATNAANINTDIETSGDIEISAENINIVGNITSSATAKFSAGDEITQSGGTITANIGDFTAGNAITSAEINVQEIIFNAYFADFTGRVTNLEHPGYSIFTNNSPLDSIITNLTLNDIPFIKAVSYDDYIREIIRIHKEAMANSPTPPEKAPEPTPEPIVKNPTPEPTKAIEAQILQIQDYRPFQPKMEAKQYRPLSDQSPVLEHELSGENEWKIIYKVYLEETRKRRK